MLLLKVQEYSQQQYKDDKTLKTAVTYHPCLLWKISFYFYIVPFFKIADDLLFYGSHSYFGKIRTAMFTEKWWIQSSILANSHTFVSLSYRL